MLPVGSAGDREILLTSRTHGTSGKAVGGGGGGGGGRKRRRGRRKRRGGGGEAVGVGETEEGES